MKIFPKKEVSNAPTPSVAKEGKVGRKKAEAPIKKELSASDIKEKLAAHNAISDNAKNMAAVKNTKRFGEAFMNPDVIAKAATEVVSVEAPMLPQTDEEVKTPNSKDLTLKTDIALNDPKDTNTQEKLKTALTRGAFNFNPKEREALEKILG
jgi:hypothetical protein